jgi:hypothetical protein
MTKWTWAATSVAVIATTAGAVVLHDRPTAIIGRILKPTGAMPPISNARCIDWSFTDTNVECSFSIAASDFPRLLNEHAFGRRVASGSSYAVAGQPHLGQPFAVAEEYRAIPPDAPHGGAIMLWTDKQHERVRLSLWIE